MTATVYHAVIEQTDSTPFVTASMKHINGASVCIEGISREFDGDWTVQDRMNKRFTKRIDFLVNVGTMGKWNNIKIELNE